MTRGLPTMTITLLARRRIVNRDNPLGPGPRDSRIDPMNVGTALPAVPTGGQTGPTSLDRGSRNAPDLSGKVRNGAARAPALPRWKGTTRR